MKHRYARIFLRCLLMLPFCAAPWRGYAQCDDWSISAQVTAASLCASNGTFTVTLSGPDLVHLSNIQYGIPLTATGFNVPLNNSASFSSIPPGSYQVSAVASCGGQYIGRTTMVTIPGQYVPPSSDGASSWPTYACANTGRLTYTIMDGSLPVTYTITSHPAAYTGPTTQTLNSRSCSFANLPAGSYTVQAVDACGSGTPLRTISVYTLNPATLRYEQQLYYSAKGCDTLILAAPIIDRFSDWSSFYADTNLRITAQVSGGIVAPTPILPLNRGQFIIKLPPGKHIKDCYGQTITYTILTPCGDTSIFRQTISYPNLPNRTDQHCNVNFTAILSPTSIVCPPVTYTLRSTTTGQPFGPYTSDARGIATPLLPLDTYTVHYVTGDGFMGSGMAFAAPYSGNPYSVQVRSGVNGLHNYIEGFMFTTSNSGIGGSRQVELFSGPAGYTFKGTWLSGSTFFDVGRNGSPTANTVLFPPGSYVWKITDDCGIYFLPITVPASALYQFSVGPPYQWQSCAGLWITPTGSAANAGSAVPVGYSILRNGSPYLVLVNGVYKWPVYPAGTSILLEDPGTYTILPTAGSVTYNLTQLFYASGIYLTYPNIYTSSYTFNYTLQAVKMDMAKTQGFSCKGGQPGSALIYAQGKDGMPFKRPSGGYYYYFLALPGNGIGGPFISSDTTGVFSGFGGNAGASYDVRVQDSCGAFAVQRIKILDLATARLIANSAFVACAGDSVRLSAIYLPNASYSWTGPNGFVSTQREPVITSIGAKSAGLYRVTITTPVCGLPVSDSTTIAVAAAPPKPIVSYRCEPWPITLEITNPSVGFDYKWDYGYPFTGSNGLVYVHSYLEESDTAYIKYVYTGGSYAAVAIDTLTGCTTKSDSLLFNTPVRMQASIYTPHQKLCTGDTATLVAGGFNANMPVRFQWLHNGVPISGATGATYVTALAGSYRVAIDAGACNADTSNPAVITIVPPPVASLTASRLSICTGDTATMQASTGAGYSYTWQLNGVTIPGAFSDTYPATHAGSYSVVISNGGCVAAAAPVNITVSQPPTVNITPSGTVSICQDSTLLLTATADPAWSYSWIHDGKAIPGATSHMYSTAVAGTYQVMIATAHCPAVTSSPVRLRVLPTHIDLGPDTTDCHLSGSFIKLLSVDSSFAQILWSTNAQTPAITATEAGIYWVRAVNQCGSFTDTVRIHDRDEFIPHLPDDTTFCNAFQSGWLRVPALLKDIRWSNGAATPNVLVTAPGTYWVEAISPCGPVSDTVRVSFCRPEIAELQLFDTSLCEGDCIPVKAFVRNYPEHYAWRFPGGNPASSDLPSPGTICYDTAGRFPVQLIIRSRGGADTVQRFITVLAKPVLRFKDTAITVPYRSVLEMPACADALHADWYLGDSLVCAGCASLHLEPRYFHSVYRCVVRNGDCPDSCSYALRVVDIPNELWLPDAFTPNGDGRNDRFHVITDNPNIQVIGLEVYNRWGQRVFISNMNNDGWDGTIHGRMADAGTYFWQLRYKVWGRNDEVYFRKGELVLVR